MKPTLCAQGHGSPRNLFPQGTSMNRDQAAIDRRQFLGQGSALVAGLTAGPAILRAADTDKKLVIGVMGLGRGLDHVKACLGLSDVEIAYLCDVDDRRLQRAVNTIAEQKSKPARA